MSSKSRMLVPYARRTGRSRRSDKNVVSSAVQQSLAQICRPVKTRGSIDPPPQDIVGRVNSTRLRFRKSSGSQVVITGDCLANLLGYQTTSAVVNRLADTVRCTHLEVWASHGVAGDSDTKTSVGEVRVLFEAGNTSAGLNPIFPTTFTDIGNGERSAHISCAPPQSLVVNCNQTNRWVFARIDGPLGTIIDITIEWAWHRIDISTVYTLTSVTTTVGLAPYNGYLDNTAVGGGVGASLAYHVSSTNQDWSGYG